MRDSMTSDAAPTESPQRPARASRPLFKPAILSAAAALALVLLTLLVLRAWVWPQLDRWRDQVQWLAGAALGRSVQIEHLTGVWNGLAPALDIRGLSIHTPEGEVGLSAVSVRGVLSPAALWSGELRFSSLVIERPALHLTRQADGAIAVAGWRIEPSGRSDASGLDWLLRQGRLRLDAGQIHISDAKGRWPQDHPLNVSGLLARESGRHRFYLDLGGIDLQALVQELAPASGQSGAGGSVASGQAALRIWGGWNPSRGSVLVLQAALDGASPRPAGARAGSPSSIDLRAMLALSRTSPTPDGSAMQTRIEQFMLSDGQGLNLSGSGEMHWPVQSPSFSDADARITLAAVELKTLEPAFRRVGALTGLSLWPQDLHLEGRLEQLAMQRGGSRAEAQGDEAKPLQLEAGVSGLSLILGQTGRDRPATGVTGLSGKIRWQPGSTQLTLDAGPLELSPPGVWAEPRLRLTRAQGEISLSRQPGKGADAPPRWTFESPDLRFATEDLVGAARLRWVSSAGAAKGPGDLQLKANIDRVAAARIGRYLPVAVGLETRRWVDRAVQGGMIEQIDAVVQGDLARFPFRDPAHGVFRISGRLREVGLDYAPGWPALQGLDGQLIFERSGFEVREATARIQGVVLRRLKGRLNDYREARLSIEGQAEGPAQALLEFIDSSPLSRTISTFTRDLRIGNAASLDLALQIPILDPGATRVQGEVRLEGNDLILDSTLPPFESVRGRVVFTESDLALRDMEATFLGGPLSLSTVPGRGGPGSLRIEATGRLEVQGIRRLLDNPLTQALEGSLGYRAEIDVDRRASSLRLRSDLSGLASSLPAPLNKRAEQPLAFEVRSTPLPAPGPQARPPGDRVEVLLGPDMQLTLERRRDEVTERLRVQRAGFGMGVSPVLRDKGLTVSMQTDQFDFDAWAALLARTDVDALQRTGGAQALPGFTLVPDWVSVVADRLRIGGQALNEVVIGASRQEGYWRANVAAREISGHFEWLDARPGEPIGTVRAQFDRLSLPRARESEVEQALARPPERLPALEISVESLELGRVPLGRLSLVAKNAGTADRPVWSLSRLEIENPHGRLSATGRWAYVPGSAVPPAPPSDPAGPALDPRSTELDLVLQVKDAGGLLGRFGIEHAVRAAPGEISGSLHWHGSPLAVDLPSLQGALQLTLGQGAFLRVDPGAARLVSVLNLQALGRLVTGDLIEIFREGFAFDSIKGQVAIHEGVIRSNDLMMRGPQATVSLQGWADLRRETQDLQVRLVPEFNANLASVAVGAMVNPAVGLGSLAAQYVLRKPLQQALAMEFDIDGSWTDPRIRQRRAVGLGPLIAPGTLPA
ncbi:MAG: YhdP family protein, partial [Burkholderiaceae bacterium]